MLVQPKDHEKKPAITEKKPKPTYFNLTETTYKNKKAWRLTLTQSGRLNKEAFNELKATIAKLDSYISYYKGFIFNSKPASISLGIIQDKMQELKKQAKDYIIAQEKELKELYTQFLTKKTLKEIIGVFGNFDMIHRYSLTNSIICYEQAWLRQMNDYIGILNSFDNWKKLKYSVKKGEKGLIVRVPAPKKFKEEDEETGEVKEGVIMHFKHGRTFDISQTTAFEWYQKQQQAMDEKVYKNYDIDYNNAQDFITSNFPEVRITINSRADNPSYNRLDSSITLPKKSSSDLFHEIGHHITEKKLKFKYKLAILEILSEITTYILTKKFDESLKFNFAYSNCWANSIPKEYELKDFESDFKAISSYIAGL